MDKLWAPWRIKYIRGLGDHSCIFCGKRKRGCRAHVIFRTKFTIAMLNLYPYNNGHMLIAPKRHIRSISQLQEREVIDLFHSLTRAQSLLATVLKPQGYNIGINESKIAGAGIAGHLHIHIVPRWQGDSNFMPVVFNTKIISQSLDELERLLRHADAGTDKEI
jgi:ATP adenylyltransferase